MTTWANDGFVPSSSPENITVHTSNSGHAWAVMSGATPKVYSSFSGAVAASAGADNEIAYISTTPPSADQRVSSTIYCDNSAQELFTGVVARLQAGGAGGYLAGHSKTNTRWEIYRIATTSPWSATLVGNSGTAGLSNSTAYDLVFEVTGSGASVSLALKVGGSAVITTTDTNASRVTANGYTGIYLSDNAPAQGVFHQTFGAEDITTVSDTGTLTGVSATTNTGNLTPTLPGQVTLTGVSATGGAGTVTPSVPGGSITRKMPPRFFDRVKDTSGVSGSIGVNGTITLNNAAPQGFRTFASVFAVNAESIPVYLGDAPSGGNDGANWMIADCTLTGSTTLRVDSIYSSSNGGAAVTFPSGTKTVFCTLPAAKAYRVKHVDAADFAIDPSFTNDSTAGMQAAIQAAYDIGVERIIVPSGRYKIAGALAGSGNCQIAVPQTREALPNRSIYIEGVSPPNFENQILRNVTPPDNGVIFESTLTTSSGSLPAVFGGEAGNVSDAWIWNYTNFGMKNCCVRTPVNAGVNKLCALNLKNFAQVVELDNLRIDTNMGLLAGPSPTAGSYGILMPPVNNHAVLRGGLIYIAGYTYGMSIEEHVSIDNLVVIGCINGIILNSAYHASKIGLFSIEGCGNAIVINGNHSLCIQVYDTEHNTVGNGFTFVTDINKITGNRKVVIVMSHIVRQSVGIDDAAFVSNDLSCYKILVGAGAN